MSKTFFAIFCLLPFLAWSQDGTETVPTAPFVASLPTQASWTVTFKVKDQTDAPSTSTPGPQRSVIREQTITKTNVSRRVITAWSDGSTTEAWSVKGYILWEQPHQKSVYIIPTGGPPLGDECLLADFPDLKWLQAANYVHAESCEGVKCLLFQSSISAVPDRMSFPASAQLQTLPLPPLEVKAWIDVKTKLPVEVYDGVFMKLFTFHGPPESQPELPPRFAKALQDYLNKVNGLANRYRMTTP